ncbi:MAG TPA: GIY-YIG nuclease family protein, partial [Candidatus Angelobacter sp.]|nr:GIY-YIG nuclease family protein [Candidatus Angelobacter sp.]
MTKPAARRFQRCYFVYLLSSLTGTLYVGLTDDLKKRMMQHKAGLFDNFTKKYKVDRLMYFETYNDPRI